MTIISHADALHAYAHAGEAQKAVRHRVDVLDEPVLTYGARPRAKLPALAHVAQPASQRIQHSLAAPASTAFKLGFGFAAGAALFRLIAAFWAVVLLLLFGSIALSMID